MVTYANIRSRVCNTLGFRVECNTSNEASATSDPGPLVSESRQVMEFNTHLTFCHVRAALTDAATARSSGALRRYFMVGVRSQLSCRASTITKVVGSCLYQLYIKYRSIILAYCFPSSRVENVTMQPNQGLAADNSRIRKISRACSLGCEWRLFSRENSHKSVVFHHGRFGAVPRALW